MITIVELVEEIDHVRDAFTVILKHPDSDPEDCAAATALRDRTTYALRLVYAIAGNPRQAELFA